MIANHRRIALALVGSAAVVAVAAAPGTAGADDLSGSLEWGSSTMGELGSMFGIDMGSLGGPRKGSPTIQPCNAKTLPGGAGVTTTRYLMGRSGPMSFRLSYETYNIPDRIEVIYQGRVVADTGYVGDNVNQGTGSINVNVPRGTDTSVTVRVTGPSGTDWDYTLYCPAR